MLNVTQLTVTLQFKPDSHKNITLTLPLLEKLADLILIIALSVTADEQKPLKATMLPFGKYE